MMTKKDFKVAAQVISQIVFIANHFDGIKRETVETYCRKFVETNPNFNIDTFMKAIDDSTEQLKKIFNCE